MWRTHAGGWRPAVLNDAVEVDFIRGAQKEFSNPRSYFIGGSTSAAHNTDIDLDSYLTEDSGDCFT